MAKLTPAQVEALRRDYTDGQTSDAELMRRYGLPKAQFTRHIAAEGLGAQRMRTIRDAAQTEIQERTAQDAGSDDVIGANASAQVAATLRHRDRIGRMMRLHDAHLFAQQAAAEHAAELEAGLLRIASSEGCELTDDELRQIADRLRELVAPKSMVAIVGAGEQLINLERKVLGIGEAGEGDGTLESFLARVRRGMQ